MVNRKSTLSIIAFGAVVIICLTFWLWPRPITTMSDNVLSWRITSEEVERKIPKGTPYDMVVEAFGTPMREVNFRFGNRLLTYFSKTNLIASNTYYGFSVYLTNNRVANLLFNRDQYSPPQ